MDTLINIITILGFALTVWIMWTTNSVKKTIKSISINLKEVENFNAIRENIATNLEVIQDLICKDEERGYEIIKNLQNEITKFEQHQTLIGKKEKKAIREIAKCIENNIQDKDVNKINNHIGTLIARCQNKEEFNPWK